jgi:hypothetical protein
LNTIANLWIASYQVLSKGDDLTRLHRTHQLHRDIKYLQILPLLQKIAPKPFMDVRRIAVSPQSFPIFIAGRLPTSH